MNERQVPAQETKSSQEFKSPEEEYIMKYVLVLQRKWEAMSNNEPTGDA